MRRNLPIWLTIILAACAGAFGMWWHSESARRARLVDGVCPLLDRVFEDRTGLYDRTCATECVAELGTLGWPIHVTIWSTEACAEAIGGAFHRNPARCRQGVVQTGGDAADLFFRITGRRHPTLKGELSAEYRAFVEGKR